MTKLVLLQQFIEEFYKKHNRICVILGKFIFVLAALLSTNYLIGYSPIIQKWYVLACIAGVSVFLPENIILFAVMAVSVMNIYYVSVPLSGLVVMFLLILYLLFLRLEKTHMYVILGMIILHILHLPYLMPLLVGIFLTPVGVISMCTGIFIYHLFNAINLVVSVSSEDALFYTQVMDEMFSKMALQEEVLIFALVAVVVYLIRTNDNEYFIYISIVVGSVLDLILFLLLNFLFSNNMEILYFILEISISFVIAMILIFFRFPLNYAQVEKMQFEDDEYYYYVKAVPKLKVNAMERSVMRFNAKRRGSRKDKEPEEKSAL
ncbi:MAG: hypothetical protein K6G11_07320 [Lachnospiraceae bacterium]|nr:hypothetical protein [Lachnospiraceae bacterium]